MSMFEISFPSSIFSCSIAVKSSFRVLNFGAAKYLNCAPRTGKPCFYAKIRLLYTRKSCVLYKSTRLPFRPSVSTVNVCSKKNNNVAVPFLAFLMFQEVEDVVALF